MAKNVSEKAVPTTTKSAPLFVFNPTAFEAQDVGGFVIT